MKNYKRSRLYPLSLRMLLSLMILLAAATGVPAAYASGTGVVGTSDLLIRDLSELGSVTILSPDDPVISDLYYPHNGEDRHDCVYPGEDITVKGKNFTANSSIPEIRLFRIDVDEVHYTQCEIAHSNDEGTRVWIKFEDDFEYLGDTPDLPIDEEFQTEGYYTYALSVRGGGESEMNLYGALYPVHLDTVEDRNKPVITKVYYEDSNGRAKNKISPLEEIIINGKRFGGLSEVNLWRNGSYYERSSILSNPSDTEVRVILSCMEDSYFISSGDELALSIRTDDGGESEPYPVKLDQRSYVEEQSQPFITPSGSWKKTGPPLDLTIPEALIIARESTAGCFEKLARVHTVTGVPTRVVTINEIKRHYNYPFQKTSCSIASTRRMIKDYIEECYDQGTEYVILGGPTLSGDNTVPSMQARLSANSRHIAETYLSDYYYAELSEWDSNGDNLQDDDDDPISYEASLGVSRIPFPINGSSGEGEFELLRYVEKVIHHLINYPGSKIEKVLFLSNEADTIFGAAISADRWFETYTEKRIPEDWDLTKLYEINSRSAWGADDLTLGAEEEELEKGPNLVVHMGHADTDVLTASSEEGMEFTAETAHGLENRGHYPIFISGGCLAGSLLESWPCAGSSYITSLFGGGIAYIGNSSLGVGPLGGAQFEDGLLEEIFDWRFYYPANCCGEILLSEVFRRALNNFTESEHWISEMTWATDGGVEDTRKSAVLLGDGLIPVYVRDKYDAPEIEVSKKRHLDSFGNYTSDFTFSFSAEYPGARLIVSTDSGSYYEVDLSQPGDPMFSIREDLQRIAVGYSAPACFTAYREIYFNPAATVATLNEESK